MWSAGCCFDWRGTLVADPPDEWWVGIAVDRLGRNRAEVPGLVDALDAAVRAPGCGRRSERPRHVGDARHREATMMWFRNAGLDDELATTLYNLDFEPANHPFFPDVAHALRALHERDVAVGLVSDIHFDLRSEFAAAGLHDLIDAYVLSFEHGVQKPDPAIFGIAAEALSLEPHELLMVGDRASHDGGAVACGIATLLVPPLHTADRPRNLAAVVALVAAADGTAAPLASG